MMMVLTVDRLSCFRNENDVDYVCSVRREKMGTSGMSNRPVANIFYQNDVTEEEIEQIRMQDNAEMLAANMAKLPGYGVMHKGNSAFGINQ